MGARFRSWWQKTSKTLDAVIIALVILSVLLVLIILGYIFNWTWTGLRGRTLYDWLQLLIIPAVLAVGGFVINLTISRGEQAATEQRTQSEREAAEKRAKTEHEIALDNQREAALQEYIDKMSELLLHADLRRSDPEKEVRNIARVRTLTTLNRLDGVRKGSVLEFLHEAKLIERNESIIDLEGANLREAYLIESDLRGANLMGAHLIGAKLWAAYLMGADLSRAKLWEADLSRAYLMGANLSRAYLMGAYLSESNLSEANLMEANLVGANLIESDLSESNLSRAYLMGANLMESNLSGANLSRASLVIANLTKSDLREADLREANLSGANLSGAKVIQEQWEKAKSLKGATMPDGSKHE